MKSQRPFPSMASILAEGRARQARATSCCDGPRSYDVPDAILKQRTLPKLSAPRKGGSPPPVERPRLWEDLARNPRKMGEMRKDGPPRPLEGLRRPGEGDCACEVQPEAIFRATRGRRERTHEVSGQWLSNILRLGSKESEAFQQATLYLDDETWGAIRSVQNARSEWRSTRTVPDPLPGDEGEALADNVRYLSASVVESLAYDLAEGLACIDEGTLSTRGFYALPVELAAAADFEGRLVYGDGVDVGAFGRSGVRQCVMRFQTRAVAPPIRKSSGPATAPAQRSKVSTTSGTSCSGSPNAPMVPLEKPISSPGALREGAWRRGPGDGGVTHNALPDPSGGRWLRWMSAWTSWTCR